MGMGGISHEDFIRVATITVRYLDHMIHTNPILGWIKKIDLFEISWGGVLDIDVRLIDHHALLLPGIPVFVQWTGPWL